MWLCSDAAAWYFLVTSGDFQKQETFVYTNRYRPLDIETPEQFAQLQQQMWTNSASNEEKSRFAELSLQYTSVPSITAML